MSHLKTSLSVICVAYKTYFVKRVCGFKGEKLSLAGQRRLYRKQIASYYSRAGPLTPMQTNVTHPPSSLSVICVAYKTYFVKRVCGFKGEKLSLAK
jgi:hypothetical protein